MDMINGHLPSMKRCLLSSLTFVGFVCGIGCFSEEAHAQWQISTIDSEGFNSRYECSMCLNAQGEPHILYQGHGKGGRVFSGDFRHVVRQDGTWKRQTVESDCSLSSCQSAIGGSGAPYILYQIFNTKDRDGLKLAWKQTRGWTKSDIYSKDISPDEMKKRFGLSSFSLGLMVSHNFCLAVDTTDVVHIAYVDPGKHTLLYGRKGLTETDWRWKSLEDVGPHKISTSLIWPSMAVSKSGKIFVAYKKYEAKQNGRGRLIRLRLATMSEGKWAFETVKDKLAHIEGRTKIWVGPSEEPIVSYTKCAYSKTRWVAAPMYSVVVRRLQNEKRTWREEFVGRPGDIVRSVVAAKSGQFRIVYTRAAKGDPDQRYASAVVVATKAAGRWSEKTVLDVAKMPLTAKVQVMSAQIGPDNCLKMLFVSQAKKKYLLTLKYGTLKLGQPK